jgi:hypothetical protein
MTVAACYVSNECVVFGADGAQTQFEFKPDGDIVRSAQWYHEQKILEVPEFEGLALLSSGESEFGALSHRTLLGRLADALEPTRVHSVVDVAREYSSLAFRAYRSHMERDPGRATIDGVPPVSVCIGGWCRPDRVPTVARIEIGKSNVTAPEPVVLSPGLHAWEFDLPARRLIQGIDPRIRQRLLASGSWTGTPEALDEILQSFETKVDRVPMRDAIDLVHMVIHTSIRLERYMSAMGTCGGPIELAVITSDKPLRWVRHKPLDAAVGPVIEDAP